MEALTAILVVDHAQTDDPHQNWRRNITIIIIRAYGGDGLVLVVDHLLP